MTGKDTLVLILLAALWGASFLFIRVTAPEFGPIGTATLRITIAALTLIVYAKIIGARFSFRAYWKGYLILGAVNAVFPFVLITTAELQLTASVASILNATSPLFTALIAWLFFKESFGGKKVAGLLIGLLGVVILVGWNPKSVTPIWVLSVLASLGAAFFYGIAGNYGARYFKGIKPLELAIGQQVGASLLILPISLFFIPAEAPSTVAVVSILALAIVSTAFAYLLFFYLLHRVGAVKTVSVTFLIPVFGVVWGILFLGESVSAGSFVGMAVIFIGVLLVTESLWDKIQSKWGRPKPSSTGTP